MVGGAALTAAIAGVWAIYVTHRHAEQPGLLPLIGLARHAERPTPIGNTASLEIAAAHARTSGPIRNPYKQPTMVSRQNLAVTHSATEKISPCRASEGAWHLAAGGTLTLDSAGRARWISGNAGQSEMISWLCHASGQIEIHLPTGLVLATQDTTGNQLTIGALTNRIVLATR